MCKLLKLGLPYWEAKQLSLEEMLSLLDHQRLEDALSAIGDEEKRLASLVMADPMEQRRGLLKLGHIREALLDRFYIADKGESDG